MVAKDDKGKNVKVPGLLLTNKEELRRFARSVERKMAVRKRDTKYHNKKFKVNEYLEFLEGENVKMDLD